LVNGIFGTHGLQIPFSTVVSALRKNLAVHERQAMLPVVIVRGGVKRPGLVLDGVVAQWAREHRRPVSHLDL
jgi:hypothetical protein